MSRRELMLLQEVEELSWLRVYQGVVDITPVFRRNGRTPGIELSVDEIPYRDHPGIQ